MTSVSSGSSSSSSKRTVHPDIPMVLSKRQRTPVPVAKTTSIICDILINDNWTTSLPNDIEMTPRTFQKLGFNEANTTANNYILIANRLYRVSCNHFLPRKSITMNSEVYQQVISGIYDQKGVKKTSVTPAVLPTQKFATVSRVTFHLKPYDALYSDTAQYRHVNLTDLERDFKEILSDRYLMYGQEFIIKLSSGLYFKVQFESVIFRDYPDQGNHAKLAKTRFVFIQADTKFDFTANKTSQLQIIRQIETPPENTELHFAIRAFSTSQEHSESLTVNGETQITFGVDKYKDAGTLVFPLNKLYERVYADLETRLIYPGLTRYLCINEHQTIELVCKKITAQGPTKPPRSLRSESYGLGVFFNNQMNITFVPDLSLQLVKDTPDHVKNIAFKVTRVISSTQLNPMQPHRPHIAIDEFRPLIRQLGIPFASGQKFHLALSSGDFLFETLSAKTAPKKPEETPQTDSDCDVFSSLYDSFSFPDYQKDETPPYVVPAWEVTDTTKIKLYKDPLAPLEIVRNHRALPLKTIKFNISSLRFRNAPITIIKENLERAIRELCTGPILPKQSFNVICDGVKLSITVDKLGAVKTPPKSMYSRYGALTEQTTIEFESNKEQRIQIISNNKLAIIAEPEAFMKELEMGGIGKQSSELIRRVFLQRGPLAEEAARRQITPVKGILLYGPPGTGKSTLAKQLGKLFGCSFENGRLRMITASAIFNKWVGKSEKNVQALFDPAREDIERFGKEKAPLHVVVLDELDGAFAKRGDRGNSVRNSVVNIFLGELQGLNSPDNILIVGITNRKDDLDPAIIRKGRLGLHIEFPLPNTSERKEIFDVHTKHLRQERLLHENVDTNELAKRSEGFSGADIKDICDEAALLSLERLHSSTPLSPEAIAARKLVTMEDFMTPLEKRTSKTEMDEYVRSTIFL